MQNRTDDVDKLVNERGMDLFPDVPACDPDCVQQPLTDLNANKVGQRDSNKSVYFTKESGKPPVVIDEENKENQDSVSQDVCGGKDFDCVSKVGEKDSDGSVYFTEESAKPPVFNEENKDIVSEDICGGKDFDCEEDFTDRSVSKVGEKDSDGIEYFTEESAKPPVIDDDYQDIVSEDICGGKEVSVIAASLKSSAVIMDTQTQNQNETDTSPKLPRSQKVPHGLCEIGRMRVDCPISTPPIIYTTNPCGINIQFHPLSPVSEQDTPHECSAPFFTEESSKPPMLDDHQDIVSEDTFGGKDLVLESQTLTQVTENVQSSPSTNFTEESAKAPVFKKARKDMPSEDTCGGKEL